ncbi:MAG: HSP90 family protein [Pseudoclavibacter sp.]|nr:HSP90 family protein [Pseudoclavibacter sp.]
MTEEAAALHPFQVDLHGVVDLLSRHIYSGPRVYLRELLQNGVDAIEARRRLDGAAESPDRGIRIRPARGAEPFRFRDEGVGLDAEEVRELLSTVGRSSKRDEFGLHRDGFLGQFGIGMLSCFMVAEAIVMRSRSAKPDAVPVEWTGRADGTFSVRELHGEQAEAVPVGTTVELAPRADDRVLLEHEAVLALAADFGQYLPVPIEVETPSGPQRVNRDAVFTRAGEARSDPAVAERLHEEAVRRIGSGAFEVIDLDDPEAGVRGCAFVLPSPQGPGTRRLHSVYLDRMLLSHRIDDLLPGWAFFVQCVIDTDAITPTASRESIVHDGGFTAVRESLARSIRSWLLTLGRTRPYRLAEFTAVHNLALRQMCIHDDELAGALLRYLELETSHGRMRIDHLVERHPLVKYAETVDDFRQIASFSPPDAPPVVNGGYVHDSELVRRIPEFFPGTSVRRADLRSELEVLETPPLDDLPLAQSLERSLSGALAETQVRVEVRSFEPADVPAVFLSDEEARRTRARREARRSADPLWSSILGTMDERFTQLRAQRDERGEIFAVLCLNWRNALIRALAGAEDELVRRRTVQLLYIQALLAGHRPLHADDRAMLTGALGDLVQLSVGLGGTTMPDTPFSDPLNDDEDAA